MRVLKLVVHVRTREPVLLLGEQDGSRCVPVFLRRPQADAIALGARTRDDPVLPQDVLVPVLGGLGRRLAAAELTALIDGVFTAQLLLDDDSRIDVLPSDALAVGVREGLPIRMDPAIVEQVGQPIEELFPDGREAPAGQPAGQPAGEQLREFREFLDGVSPEDFDRPGR